MNTDFPLFACVFSFTAVSGRRYVAVLGALRYGNRGEPKLVTVAGHVVYPWAIADQKAVLSERGIGLP
jgi:hypothetical protein